MRVPLRFVCMSLCAAFAAPSLAEAPASIRQINPQPAAIERGIGADLCPDAQFIEGAGTFDFDNSNALTDGLAHSSCLFFGQSQITRDVWFRWRADCTGPTTLETCGMTFVDTKIAIYAPNAPCPPTDEFLVDCDDDSCDLRRNTMTFFAVAGQTYLIRIGSFPGSGGSDGPGGSGTFTITCGEEPVLCEDGYACQDSTDTDARNSTAGSFRVADNFFPVASGDVTGLCFRGVYGSGFGPAPAVPDSFRVTYYADNGAGGVGLPIASFFQGSDLALEGRRDTGELLIAAFPVWEYSVCHAPVPVSAGQTYWVEITNDISAMNGTFWYWQDGAGGDSFSFQDDSPFDSYANAVNISSDRAFCLKFETCPTDINKNGVTDFGDLNAILVQFGFSCD